MVLLKSKWFWLCSIFTFWAAIFLGIVLRQANQPQEVIKVYKAVELPQHRTPQEPAPPLSSDSASAETDPPVDWGRRDFSQVPETDTTETLRQDALPPADVDTKTVSHPADVDTKTVSHLNTGAVASQQLAELRIELPQLLEYRLDLLERVEELAPSNGAPPELSPLRDKLDEEAVQLRRTIFELGNDYITNSGGDFSPFRPGGEFYELLRLNHMGFQKVVE